MNAVTRATDEWLQIRSPSDTPRYPPLSVTGRPAADRSLGAVVENPAVPITDRSLYGHARIEGGVTVGSVEGDVAVEADVTVPDGVNVWSLRRVPASVGREARTGILADPDRGERPPTASRTAPVERDHAN